MIEIRIRTHLSHGSQAAIVKIVSRYRHTHTNTHSSDASSRFACFWLESPATAASITRPHIHSPQPSHVTRDHTGNNTHARTYARGGRSGRRVGGSAGRRSGGCTCDSVSGAGGEIGDDPRAPNDTNSGDNNKFVCIWSIAVDARRPFMTSICSHTDGCVCVCKISAWMRMRVCV